MVKTTRKQREALKSLWMRIENNRPTYRAFRKTVQPMVMDTAILVPLWGMWIGIEPDGYCHS